MKKGFTLAEILITLAIIGVVAALTIPTLVEGYQKKVLATQLKKAYNQVSTALSRAMEDEGVDGIQRLSWDIHNEDIERGKAFFKKYLNTESLCVHNDMSRCMGETYSDFNGKTAAITYLFSQMDMSNEDSLPVCGVLQSSATVCIAGPRIIIDVNGSDSPNKLGMDLFYYSVGDQGTKPKFPDSKNNNTYDNMLNGIICHGAYIEDGNVNGPSCMMHVMSNGWKIK